MQTCEKIPAVPVAQLAMLEYPIIGQWEIAKNLRNAWAGCDHEHLSYLRKLGPAVPGG
jgi:hypothetical protein